MRRLGPRVNIIPVIAKSDTLTPEEISGFKARIMEDIAHYQIPIFNFPYDAEEDDDETIEQNKKLQRLLPFAVVGGDEIININGNEIRCRRYPWGRVEIDNPAHCDVVELENAIWVTHLKELRDSTNDILYENYRTAKLAILARESVAGSLTG